MSNQYLGYSNVATMIEWINTEAERAADSGDAEHLDYFDGLRFGQETMRQMWRAAEIVAGAFEVDEERS